MSTLNKGWHSIALEDIRPHPEGGTYSLFSYNALPPLPDIFNGHFDWLKDSALEAEIEGESEKLWNNSMKQLEIEANKLKIDLPEAFVSFLKNGKFRQCVEDISVTACYFEITNGIIKIPNAEDEYLIHFLSDQQYCLLWYLFIKNNKVIGVVTSDYLYEKDGSCEAYDEDGEAETKIFEYADLVLQSDSFERFMYRFWFENMLWLDFKDHPTVLNEEQRRYLSFYKR